MDFARAFNYVFEDKAWVEKVVICVILSFLSGIPIFGLIALAALLGYAVELLQNVRDGVVEPLPRWKDYGELIARGGNVLVAWIAYMIPNALVICCLASVPGFVQDSDLFSGGFAVTALCCLVPLLLVYNLVTVPMLALGMVRYAETGTIGVFFQFSDLLATLNANFKEVGQWFILAFLASVLLGLLNIIPCLGWLASTALAVPVQGHLLGQFAALLEGKPKRKPKRAGSF